MVCPVEGPTGVDAGIEVHTLFPQRVSQTVPVGYGAALHLTSILYPLDLVYRDPLPAGLARQVHAGSAYMRKLLHTPILA